MWGAKRDYRVIHSSCPYPQVPSTHPGDKVSMSFRGSGLLQGKVQIMELDEMGFEVSIRKEQGVENLLP